MPGSSPTESLEGLKGLSGFNSTVSSTRSPPVDMVNCFFLLFRIGYVELAQIDLVEKALALSGTVVMGLQIKVELTEAERNKQQAVTFVPSASVPGPASG